MFFCNYCCSIENSASIALGFAQKASDRFMVQDLGGAIEYLNEAIRNNPENPQWYLNRGFVKHVLRDYNGALDDYNLALKINPNFAFAYNNRGVLKVSMNDTQGAFKDYEIALSKNPNYSDVYYNRGNLKYMLNDLKGALSDYDKAIELNPKDSEAYNNRGVVKKRLNFNVGALSDYSQAIALDPKDSIAYANRGRLKKLYFDNEGAAIDLNQAIELAETQVFIKNVKPLLSKEQYIAAIPSVKSFTQNPYPVQKTQDVMQQSKILAESHLYNNKIEMYSDKDVTNKEKSLQKTEPVNSVNQIANAKTVAQKSDFNDKRIAYSKPAQKNNTPMFNAGVGKVKMPEVPDIRTVPVTKKATTNVKLAESYYIRGLQKCILGDLNGAMADLDKAISNNSQHAEAHFYRAAIKKELGDLNGFRTDYALAIQIKPSLQGFNDANALTLIQ